MTTMSDVPDAATLIARAASLRPLLERNAEKPMRRGDSR